MSELNVPQPKNKVVKFDQVKSFDQALDYAMGGYHASQKHANGDTPEGRLWQEGAILSANKAVEIVQEMAKA